MNDKILALLENNQIKNDSQLPYWIYKVETVFASGKRFLKIYLFNKCFDGNGLDLITFVHNGQEYSVSSFSVVSEFGNKNIVGGAFEIPVEDHGLDVIAKKEIVGGKVITSGGVYVEYKKSVSPAENGYLKEKCPTYRNNCQSYPQINDEWWQCSCGRIHEINEEKCLCGQTISNAREVLTFDFEENHIQDFLNKGPEFDIKKSFEENITVFGQSIEKKHNIAGEKLVNRLDLEQERNKYTSLVNADLAKKRKNKKIRNWCIATFTTIVIAIVCLFSFAPEYKSYFQYRFLTSNYQEMYKGLSSLNVLDSKAQANKAYKQRMEALYADKNYTSILSMVSTDNGYVSTVTKKGSNYSFSDSDIQRMYDDSRYEDALESLSNKKNIVSVISTLKSLGDYKDSSSKLKDAKWVYVKQNYNNINTTTYNYLKELKSSSYSGASSAYSELYDWKITAIFNNSKTDETTSKTSLSRYDTWYCHAKLSGGYPGENVHKLTYSISYPDGDRDNDIDWGYWTSGTSGTAWSWYSNPGYGSTGTLTYYFYLDGKSIGSKSVKITK